jgi:hypothetical protein
VQGTPAAQSRRLAEAITTWGEYAKKTFACVSTCSRHQTKKIQFDLVSDIVLEVKVVCL